MKGRRTWSKLGHLFSLITVEPVMFLHTLMSHTTLVVRSNLFMDKACRLDLNYTDATCANLTRHGHTADIAEKRSVESRVAEIDLYDGIITALPAILFCLFIGSWSDHHGRKPLLIVPVFGSLLTCVALILNCYFFAELGTWNLLWASGIGALFGGPCFAVGLFSYIADVTEPEGRTTRMSVLSGVYSLGYVVGVSLGGWLYKVLNEGGDGRLPYYVIFGISGGLGVLCILYTVFFITESVVVNKEEAAKHGLIDLANVKECLATAFKKRPSKGRMRVIVLLLNFFALDFIFNSSKFDYLLAQLKFDWTIVEFSNYLSVQRICHLLGLFLLLPLLSKVLGLRDSLVAACCIVFSVAAYLLMALADSTWAFGGLETGGWVMFLSAALQCESMVAVVIRSACTKTVGAEEAGRVLAVLALVAALVPLVASPLFGFTYRATIDTFPGAYLVVMDCLLLIALFGSCFLYCLDRRQQA